ncbi:MAG: sulfurtransferase TusA family protein [Planctomycetes bacterium]|nr:sulfurtransferase TusA family protein [Planctomycetota bacterium]MBL7144404.1 sulfurtransferase TusA family protein [Phycisphaerae bacterium]
MSKPEEPILHIPQSVKEDTHGYRSQVKKFLDGQTSPVAFRAYRVPMGIYEQRAAGKFMVRIRIGAGLVLPHQLERIAHLSKTYGNGIVHVTTRQDIQIHEVDIEDSPDVLEGLLEAGLSSRGGGGNTVRNVTACPEAGVCPEEEFDVAPYAIAAAEYLLKDRSSFNLPRKYKIVFSGCSKDCAFASIADLGFFAHMKNEAKGFSVYAAGGLGSNPAVAAKIEDFIEAEEIFEVAEAVKKLFDKYGDRANKHKARLRYVLARVGIEKFIKLYRAERDILKTEGLPYTAPQICEITSIYKVPKTSITVRLRLKNGDIPADDLSKVGQIAAKYGQGLIRTTQLQDLLITGIVKEDNDKVHSELKKLSIDVFGDGSSKIVACAGASTCKLGLCLSRGLAEAISNKLSRTASSAGLSETTIRISGCPNSCGHHYIAAIGLQGKAKRVNGKLMPCYDVLVGAKTIEGDAHLGKRIGTVPAKKIPELLAEVFDAGEINEEKLKNRVGQYSDFSSEQFPDDYYYDFGSNEPFSLAGRGPGECGAGVTDVIKLDIDEAKDALKSAPTNSENIYKAVIAAARALMVTFGLEPKKDREIFAAFTRGLIEPGWVKPQTQQLLDDAIDWRMGDKESIEDLFPQAEDLTKRVEELYLSLDANLKFKIEPVAKKTNVDKEDADNHVIDLRGVGCPLNFVKAKLELEKLDTGAILGVLLDEGEPVRNVPASFAEQGQEVLEVKNSGDHFFVKVRRKK